MALISVFVAYWLIFSSVSLTLYICVFPRPGSIWEPPKQRMNRSFWRSVPSDSECCGRAAERGCLLGVWCHKDRMVVMGCSVLIVLAPLSGVSYTDLMLHSLLFLCPAGAWSCSLGTSQH